MRHLLAKFLLVPPDAMSFQVVVKQLDRVPEGTFEGQHQDGCAALVHSCMDVRNVELDVGVISRISLNGTVVDDDLAWSKELSWHLPNFLEQK